MSQPEHQELTPETGEVEHHDPIMAALLKKDEDRPVPEGDEPEGQAEPEQEEEGNTPEPDAPPADEELEFELDGKPVKLKKSELPNVYRNQLLDADYRRKTTELAETKRALEVAQQETQQKRDYLANQLDPMLHLVREQLIGSQETLAKLAVENPAEWVKENQAYQQRAAQFQALIQHRQALAQQAEAEAQQQQAEFARQNRERLHEVIPEWRDSTVADKERLQVAEYLIESGYSQDDLNMLTDVRALKTARDAAMWKAHLKAQASVKEKQAAPQPRKTITPSAAHDPNTKRTAYQDTLAKAKRTGKPDDVLAALMQKG